MEQPDLPAIPSLPTPAIAGFVLLADHELHTFRQRLIEADGDMEKAGISMPEMRNIIYTCRMKANPMQEASEETKAKKTRTTSTNKEKISGPDVNNFLE
jgi:hypothetical protein